MIASSVAHRAVDAYARIRLPAAEATGSGGRTSTSELATKPSVGPDVLLRQLRSGRATAEVATAYGPMPQAHGSFPGKPAATFTRAGQGDDTGQVAAVAPALVNVSMPGAQRVAS